MIPIAEIERFYAIVDREIAFLEMRDNMKKGLQARLINNWLFIRETFRKVCFQCAQCEGIIKKDV